MLINIIEISNGIDKSQACTKKHIELLGAILIVCRFAAFDESSRVLWNLSIIHPRFFIVIRMAWTESSCILSVKQAHSQAGFFYYSIKSSNK